MQEPSTPTEVVACGSTCFPAVDTLLILPPEHQANNLVCPITQPQAVALEQATVTQAACSHWFQARQKRITASQFGEVLKRKKDVNTKFLTRLFGSKSVETPATQYGKSLEATAKSAYLGRGQRSHLHDCGLAVHPAFSFFGASPDAKVCEEGITGIVEVKCPFSARDMKVQEAAESLSQFCLQSTQNQLCLKKAHAYFFQVQGQLMITGAPFCDFVLYTNKDVYVERILPDRNLHQDMLVRLSAFYHTHALPFLSNIV